MEFRLSGSARKYVKETAFDVSRQFDVRGVTKNRIVPHITIIGPIKTSQEQKLINEIIETCMKYDLMTIKFSGFRSFGIWLLGNRVLGARRALPERVAGKIGMEYVMLVQSGKFFNIKTLETDTKNF